MLTQRTDDGPPFVDSGTIPSGATGIKPSITVTSGPLSATSPTPAGTTTRFVVALVGGIRPSS